MSVPTSRLYSGSPLNIDYTPGSDVTAGDVIVQDDLIGVAPRDIDANTLGALQAVGPSAVFIFPKTAGTGLTMSAGAVVYWDASSEVATTTASTHKVLGKVVTAATATETSVKVMGVQQATP